jgi:hypothetical protein
MPAKLGLPMDTVLNDQRKAQHLYRFAKQQLCGENIDFIYACRQLNPTLGTAVFKPIPLSTVAQGPAAAAQYVYDRFIVAAGNHPGRVQVNLNASTKRAVDQHSTQGTLGAGSFNGAYQDVVGLVRNDTWQKFALPQSHQVAGARPYWDNNDLRGYIQY